MGDFDCDILVIGAGPAGSSAARAAALEGLRVVLVDRRSVLGVPVQCAEYIPAQLVGAVHLGRDFIVQSVSNMDTILEGRLVKRTPAPGFIIHRDRFDQQLAAAARAAGAVVHTATRAVARKDVHTVVLRRSDGRLMPIRTRIIVGADGPRSTVARWIGAEKQVLLPGIQARAVLAHPLFSTEIYFEPEVFAGYCWLFPKGESANVGLACRRPDESMPHMRVLLDRFVERLQRMGRITGLTGRYCAGWIPVKPRKQIVRDNVLLSGDAAGQVHPMTGAGVATAVAAGRMAGKCAARSILQQRIERLHSYAEECRDFFGDMLDRGWQRRQALEKGWPRLDETLKRCWVAFREYHAGGT